MLDAFGLAAVTATLLFYAFEDRSAWCILGFAAGCVASSVYGFLQGAWPFGVVEIAWTMVAIRRWFRVRSASAGVHATDTAIGDPQ
jgi:hypothetical protein